MRPGSAPNIGIIIHNMTAHTHTVNGLQLHYTVEGQGPDVVFIHGWLSSRRMWAHLAADLASAYRCWTIDLPGCGDSEKPADGWYSIPNYTASLREFMRLTGIARASVVGHSMGGLIALDFAAEHRELVDRLVTINPVVSGRATIRPLARRIWSRPLLGLTLRLSPMLIQPVLDQPLLNTVAGVEFLRRRTQDFAKGTVDSIIGTGRATVAYSVASRLPMITAPTLVLLGTLDMMISNQEGQLVARRVPGARLTALRAGHVVTDDRPAETLQLVREFLA